MRLRPSLTMAWLLCALLLVLRATEAPKYALGWDVFGYYLYLPATFIHDDIRLQDKAWLDSLMEEYSPSSTLYQLVDVDGGGRMIKYSMGMAVVFAPFFLLAHVLAEPLGFPADGLSAPYHYLITFGCMLYILAGIFIFRRLLLHFFNEKWTAIVLALIVLGTNYLHLAVWDGTLLTHSVLFTLYALLLLATIEWHHKPDLRSAMMIGLSGGMIALIRPPEAIVMLVPLLWAAHSSRKWRDLIEHPFHSVIVVIAFCMVLLPQGLYWKMMTGDWITNSYANNAGEGFDLWSPHLGNYLFSFRKGWFVYTPLMLLAIFGLPWLWRRQRALFWPLVIYLPLQLWIVSSWTTWWYAGGSFSARSMVPAYVLLAVPLGGLLQQACQHRPSRVLFSTLSIVFILLNLFQTWQWRARIMSKDRMTRDYYFATFGRTSVPAGAEELLLVDRSIAEEGGSFDPDRYQVGRTIFESDRSVEVILSAESPFLPGPELSYRDITKKDHAWIRATAMLWVDSSTTAPPLIVMAFHHEGKNYGYRTTTWELAPGAQGWIPLTMDHLTPEVRTTEDIFKAYIWNMHGGTHRIKEFRVQVFEPER